MERSILGDGCIIEPDAKILHSVVGLRSIIREVGRCGGGGVEGVRILQVLMEEVLV